MGLSPQSLTEVRFRGREPVRSAQPAPARVASWDPGERKAERLTDAERRFVAAVFWPVGLDPEQYRSRPLRRRFAAALRGARMRDVEQALVAMRTDPDLAGRLGSSLLIGHTTPFRDEAVFQRLRESVVPERVAERGPLRVWSAACSHGAELYSLALILAEAGVLEASALLGTDGRAAAIADAPRYAKTFFESIPEPFRGLRAGLTEERFLELTRAIEWRRESVFAAVAEREFDIVCCRNLAIYLESTAASRLWDILARALSPGGILVTGKAEKPLPSRRFERVDACIYRVTE
jgi:chemotaxis protein methyltransferase CheR